MSCFKFISTCFLLALLNCSYFLHATTPSYVHVTLRGKKYRVPCKGTVKDLQCQVEEQSGVSAVLQGRVLFDGRHLKSSDKLGDVGVKNGSIINVIPSKFFVKENKPNADHIKKYSKNNVSNVVNNPSSKSGDYIEFLSENPDTCSKRPFINPGTTFMKSLLEKSGMDHQKIEKMKNILSSMSSGDMLDMDNTIKLIQTILDNPIFHRYINDPAKLEQGRQLLIKSPIMNDLIRSLPSLEEVLNDPLKWRQTMVEGVNLCKNIGNNMETVANYLDSKMFGFAKSWSGTNNNSDPTSCKLSALNNLSEI